MTSNFIKICTAALAGSIIGIVYERLGHVPDLPSAIKTVSADGSLLPRFGKNSDGIAVPRKSLPQVDPVISTENLKHSAKFGLPSKDNLRIFNDFVISYDRRLRSPVWVIEHLTPQKLKNKKGNRDKSSFEEDPILHEFFRAKLEDFKNSGYDRGHMAAAGNHKNSQDDLDQTFSLSNISPQVPEFNRGGWEKLERYVRFRASAAKNLYVVTGPLYLPTKARDGNLYVTYRVLGNNHISVPTHYFKVFLVETEGDKLSIEAFLMPNDKKLDGKINLDDYRLPIERLDVIERASGSIFFDQVPRNNVDAPRRLLAGFKDESDRSPNKGKGKPAG